jgi:hypothetical protein
VNDIFRQIAKENGTTEKAVKEEMQFAIREAMKSAEPEAIAFWKAVAPDGKEPPIGKILLNSVLKVPHLFLSLLPHNQKVYTATPLAIFLSVRYSDKVTFLE